MDSTPIPKSLPATRFSVLPTQEIIAGLAERIEQAYGLRYPKANEWGISPGAFEAAAAGLTLLHRNRPMIPVDPELFVAVQPVRTWSDPWTELTSEESYRRYRRHVRRIVTRLRTELRNEIRWGERRVRRGSTVVETLNASDGRVSALGRYVIARRAGLDELAERLRPQAERQHRSCPLYQHACRSFLPDDAYPQPRATVLKPGLVIPAGLDLPGFSLN